MGNVYDVHHSVFSIYVAKSYDNIIGANKSKIDQVLPLVHMIASLLVLHDTYKYFSIYTFHYLCCTTFINTLGYDRFITCVVL